MKSDESRGSLNRSDERGLAHVEFAIVAPFLIFLLMGIYDLGRALERYIALNSIAYEGLRYAATLPGLEGGEFNAPTGVPMYQETLRDRINNLLEGHGWNPATAGVTTALYTEAAPDAQGRSQIVRVSISAPYESLFKIYADAGDLHVTASGAYLFPESS